MTASRALLPGEHLSPDCGHHCGIRSAADEGRRTFIGHCFCDECRCPMGREWTQQVINIPMVTSETLPAGTFTLENRTRRVPMCDSWQPRCYKAALGFMVHGPGCTCPD